MPSSEERLAILNMIQQGTISAEQGLELLNALAEKIPSNTPNALIPQNEVQTKSSRWFRVKITETNSERVRVNIRLPVSVLSAGLKMGARFSPEIESLNMEKLLTLIRSGETGNIVDVLDEEDKEHVEVYIE